MVVESESMYKTLLKTKSLYMFQMAHLANHNCPIRPSVLENSHALLQNGVAVWSILCGWKAWTGVNRVKGIFTKMSLV